MEPTNFSLDTVVHCCSHSTSAARSSWANSSVSTTITIQETSSIQTYTMTILCVTSGTVGPSCPKYPRMWRPHPAERQRRDLHSNAFLGHLRLRAIFLTTSPSSYTKVGKRCYVCRLARKPAMARFSICCSSCLSLYRSPHALLNVRPPMRRVVPPQPETCRRRRPVRPDTR